MVTKDKDIEKLAAYHQGSLLLWQECAVLPYPRKHLQAVEYKGKIYVGSGYSGHHDADYFIYCYNPKTNKWEKLDSATRFFALTVYKDTILLIGGKADNGSLSNQIQCLSEDGKKFKISSIPGVLTGRCGASAVSFNTNCLVVAGGLDNSGNSMKKVEIYDGHSWQQGPDLPLKCAFAQSALLNGDQWFLLGGTDMKDKVLMASLESIYKYEPGLFGASKLWNEVGDVHECCFSCISVINGKVFALGGAMIKDEVRIDYSTNIFLYNNEIQDDKPKWKLYTEHKLRVACQKCTAITLMSGEIFVLGGQTKEDNFLCDVYKMSCEHFK